MATTTTITDGIAGAAKAAETVVEQVMKVEPTIAGIAGMFVPQVALVQPWILMIAPYLERALTSLSQEKNGDALTALLELIQHVSKGQPNAPSLSPAPSGPITNESTLAPADTWMSSLEEINIAVGGGSLLLGIIGGMIAGVWRVARIEGRLKSYIHEEISYHDAKFSEKMDQTTNSFDETLRGLQTKINQVELEGVQSFVNKEDFNDFRSEYREDMRDLKTSVDTIINNGTKIRR